MFLCLPATSLDSASCLSLPPSAGGEGWIGPWGGGGVLRCSDMSFSVKWVCRGAGIDVDPCDASAARVCAPFVGAHSALRITSMSPTSMPVRLGDAAPVFSAHRPADLRSVPFGIDRLLNRRNTICQRVPTSARLRAIRAALCEASCHERRIPSLRHSGQTVFDETLAFNEAHKPHSMARLVDRRRAKMPVSSMGFSMQDRVELLKLSTASESDLAASCITDWLSPGFFDSEFWSMWVTTFAFQPSHSAVEFKR